MDEDRLATVTDLPNYTLWGNDSTVTRQAAALNWIVAHFVDTTEQGEEGEEKPPPQAKKAKVPPDQKFGSARPSTTRRTEDSIITASCASWMV